MTAAMAQTLTMFPPYYLVASELLTTDNQQVQSHPIRTGMGLGALVFVARNGLSYILDQLNKCSGNMTDPPPIYLYVESDTSSTSPDHVEIEIPVIPEIPENSSRVNGTGEQSEGGP